MFKQIKKRKAIALLASASVAVALIMWKLGIYVFLLSVGAHSVNWPLTILLWLALTSALSLFLKLALVKS